MDLEQHINTLIRLIVLVFALVVLMRAKRWFYAMPVVLFILGIGLQFWHAELLDHLRPAIITLALGLYSIQSILRSRV